jgi:hypothetical protein
MLVVLAWLIGLFAFVGLGASTGQTTLVASPDCVSKTAQTRLAPNVRVTAKGTTAQNVQRTRTPTPSRSFTDGPRGCGR